MQPVGFSKRTLSLLILFLLSLGLVASIVVVRTSTDTRKHAANAVVTLALYPMNEIIPVGQTRTFDLKATFSGGSATETLDYLRTEIVFPRNVLRLPDNAYVTTFFAGEPFFGRIIRIDGPVVGNQTGKITIEMGASAPGSGPPTDRPFTVGRITLIGTSASSGPLSIGSTTGQIVNNQSVSMTVVDQATTVSVTADEGSVTPTVTLAPQPTCSSSGVLGDATCDQIVNDADYNRWIIEFRKEIATRQADFNGDGVVDAVDYEIWRRHSSTFQFIPSITPVPLPTVGPPTITAMP